MRSLRHALALGLLLSACAHRSGLTLDDAARAVAKGSRAPAPLALAGFHALLVEPDVEKARAHFDESLAADPAQPWALWGQVVLALRSAHPERATEAALSLLEQHPTHPLAAAAARLLLDVSGQAASSDALLVERGPRVLERGLPGDAGHLLRSALATIALARGDLTRHQTLLSELGVPTAFAVVGPLSAWHALGMGKPTPFEATGDLSTLPPGPFGKLEARVIEFADGRFSLGGEPGTGDVYLLAVDVEVPERGRYVLRTITSMEHVAVLDGTPLLERLTSERPAPTLQTRAVKLEAGTHRLLLRVAREDQAGFLTVALQRLDGRPANVSFHPASGPAPRWSGVTVIDAADGLYATARSLADALADEGGEVLARFVAARDGLGRDHDGARRLLAELPDGATGPVLRVLRAELELADRTVPAKVARGHATRELEAALAKDPGFIAAMMTTAQLALDDGRQLDALEQLKRARASDAHPGAPLLQEQARVELALGLDAQAASTARAAEAAWPGTCDALLLQYDVARRRDAVAEADALLTRTAACPNGLARTAEHERTRGHLEAAEQASRALLARDGSQVSVATSLANLLVAQGHFEAAQEVLGRLTLTWPRNAALKKALADVAEHEGHRDEALRLRELALALDGSDLSLLRAVTRARTGKELLAEYAISTEEALKAYEAAPGNEDANAAFLLDAAAIRAFPDGSQVDRIHTIQKALDQQGVQDIAEVTLPEGAQVLKLRTLKADGTTLEPETIDGKDAVSLPGVQVGDLVEQEYLLAHPSRGPGQPGFTSSAFYFQVARQPNNWSTYVVVAPKGSHLKVDAHNMQVPGPVVKETEEVFAHEERRVPPYVPEPQGPPTANEWLPFVSVGAGQEGNEGVLLAYADAFAHKGQVTWEVERFATAAVAPLAVEARTGVEGVRAVYGAVMQKLSGRDAGLSTSAAASVSQDRGSRTWLLAAALRALGFTADLVAVRTFTADPAPSLFPNEALLPYVCVRVKVGAEFIWLDPLVRYAPFGELPEWAMGERDAWVLPRVGGALEQTKTPPLSARPSKEVSLTLSLTAEGVLSGAGEETYQGFEAAQLAEALESMSPDQRDQALQGALSRYFGGADLSSLKVESTRAVGAPVKVTYGFTARRFGRPEGDGRLVLGPLTFPSQVGRRFLSSSSRVTPLFIDGSETTHTHTTLTLPAGWALKEPVADLSLEDPAGSYARHETQVGATVTIDEQFRLVQARVSPRAYPTFGRFAGEVDLVQGRDLLLERR
jgi:tetratricopeptide (TPR) repeat protein